jgi:hypothetical protein
MRDHRSDTHPGDGRLSRGAKVPAPEPARGSPAMSYNGTLGIQSSKERRSGGFRLAEFAGLVDTSIGLIRLDPNFPLAFEI